MEKGDQSPNLEDMIQIVESLTNDSANNDRGTDKEYNHLMLIENDQEIVTIKKELETEEPMISQSSNSKEHAKEEEKKVEVETTPSERLNLTKIEEHRSESKISDIVQPE